MAVLTVQDVIPVGTTPAYVAAAGGGDSFVRDTDGRYWIEARNSNAASRDITIAPGNPNTLIDNQQVSVGSIVVTVPALTGEVMIGPITREFLDANGSVAITYSAVTNLTVGVFRMV